MRPFKSSVGVGFFVCLIQFAGCGHDPLVSKVMEKTPTNLDKVICFYRCYHSKNGFAGPKDEAELKAFLATPAAAESLRLLGVDQSNVDKYFVNEVDEKPFKIRYGIDGGQFGVDEPIVFEAIGTEGKRRVAFGNGKTKTPSDQEYELWLAGEYQGSVVRDPVSDRNGEAAQYGTPPEFDQ